MKQTNFDRYLKEQLADPTFARRFEQAGQAWDVALQIATLRRQAGLSQKQLAERVKTSQQQICRLESPGYEGHSLSMLRRVAREPVSYTHLRAHETVLDLVCRLLLATKKNTKKNKKKTKYTIHKQIYITPPLH